MTDVLLRTGDDIFAAVTIGAHMAAGIKYALDHQGEIGDIGGRPVPDPCPNHAETSMIPSLLKYSDTRRHPPSSSMTDHRVLSHTGISS